MDFSCVYYPDYLLELFWMCLVDEQSWQQLVCVIVHHLIEVGLLKVFWQVEGTNVGPLIIVIRMLVVCVTLACIVCVSMYTGRDPMQGWT